MAAPRHLGAASEWGLNCYGVLASGEKDGYRFIPRGMADGYTLNANPVTSGKSGWRSFYSDETLAVHRNWGAEAATAESPEAGEKGGRRGRRQPLERATGRG